MGKDWDAPWKYQFNNHGYSDGGLRRPAPSFASSRNPTCQECGYRQRTWAGGPPRCECEVPAFDSVQDTVNDRQKFQMWCVSWLTECYRVTCPGGIIKVFGATRMFHRMAAAMEEAGFILPPEHSLEAWGYASGFPKSLDISKALGKKADVSIRDDEGLRQDFESVDTLLAPVTPEVAQFAGYGTALKPAWEPFIVGIKPS